MARLLQLWLDLSDLRRLWLRVSVLRASHAGVAKLAVTMNLAAPCVQAPEQEVEQLQSHPIAPSMCSLSSLDIAKHVLTVLPGHRQRPSCLYKTCMQAVTLTVRRLRMANDAAAPEQEVEQLQSHPLRPLWTCPSSHALPRPAQTM